MTLARVARRVRDDDRGAGYFAAFIVLCSMLLVLGIGILVDSGRYFASYRQAGSMALEAARAGANAVTAEGLGGGEIIIDPGYAQALAAEAVAAFVSNSAVSLESVTIDGDRVTVRVTEHVDSWFPFMPDRTVTREATAVATTGQPP